MNSGTLLWNWAAKEDSAGVASLMGQGELVQADLVVDLIVQEVQKYRGKIQFPLRHQHSKCGFSQQAKSKAFSSSAFQER